MDVDSDDDAADVQHPLADELFGADPEVEARLSRRQATLHKQGSRFWGALEDFQLPRSHKRLRMMEAWQQPSVDSLFEDDDQLGLQPGLAESNRVKAALCRSRKAAIGAKRCAASAPPAGLVRQSAWKIKQVDWPGLLLTNQAKATLCRLRKAELEDKRKKAALTPSQPLAAGSSTDVFLFLAPCAVSPSPTAGDQEACAVDAQPQPTTVAVDGPATPVSSAHKPSALKSSNRAKLVSTIFRKKATRGFKSLDGMQRAILYDANALAVSTGASRPSLVDSVHVEDWEEEGFETAADPLSDAPSADDSESSDVEVGPATVDDEFVASYQAYEAASAAAAATDTATAERLARKRSAPDEETVDDDVNLSTLALQDLLELTDDGIAVVWPPGIDARIARLLLLRRRTATSAKKLCDRAAPA